MTSIVPFIDNIVCVFNSVSEWMKKDAMKHRKKSIRSVSMTVVGSFFTQGVKVGIECISKI